MTDERFNELLNGPLNHPMLVFTVTRLQLALRFVVESAGDQGDIALESFCVEQQARDANDSDYWRKRKRC